MLFYFVRHGQTQANRQELLAGAGCDFPLNEEGHAQAEKVGRAIKQALGHPVHRLIVSSMLRTRETASYIARHLEIEPEIVPDFREWHLGEWEGKSFHEFGHLLLGDGEPREGEARAVFYSRVDRAWKSVHCDRNPYVIVSHGAVWLALQDILKIPRFKVDNCDLVKVHSDGKGWQAQILTLK